MIAGSLRLITVPWDLRRAGPGCYTKPYKSDNLPTERTVLALVNLRKDGLGGGGSAADRGSVLDHLVVLESDQIPADRPGQRELQSRPQPVFFWFLVVIRAVTLRVSVS
jgi:hypothetical protein